ncbi:MAG: head-tail adaptor protein [Armatimonadota bacterium]
MDARELASARQTVEATFTDVATVTRQGWPERNRQGGAVAEHVPLASYRCRLLPGPGLETVEGGRIVSVTTWRALLPYNADVRPTDRLTIHGVEYEVIATSDGASVELELRAELRRVQ